jgi:hypothetical protein
MRLRVQLRVACRVCNGASGFAGAGKSLRPADSRGAVVTHCAGDDTSLFLATRKRIGCWSWTPIFSVTRGPVLTLSM